MSTQLNVGTPGVFGVLAKLHSANGAEVTSLRFTKTLAGGLVELAADFSGAEIRQSQLDGPYTAEITLISADEMATSLSRSVAAVSGPLRASQFGGPKKILLPLVRR